MFPDGTCLKTNAKEQRHQNLHYFVFVSDHQKVFKKFKMVKCKLKLYAGIIKSKLKCYADILTWKQKCFAGVIKWKPCIATRQWSSLDVIIIRSHNNIKVRHDCKKFRFKYSLVWIYAPSGIHRDGVHTVSQTQKDCRVIYKRIENILQGQCHHKWYISIVNSSW